MKVVAYVIGISFGYGIWFNLLDSICAEVVPNRACVPIGEIFGGNLVYQPWNVVGHAVPLAFMYVFHRKKIEYPLAGLLLSTAVMDSPVWGWIRIARGSSLWCAHPTPPDCTVSEWATYYYNPIGDYLVWHSPFITPNFPNAAFMFWSLIARFAASGLLIILQRRIEDQNWIKLGKKEGLEEAARTSLLRTLENRRSRPLKATSKVLRKLAAVQE